MKPGSEPQDDEIVKLLKAMKAAPRAYPPELLSRRQAFLAQLNALNESNIEDAQPRRLILGHLQRLRRNLPIHFPTPPTRRRLLPSPDTAFEGR